MTEATQKQGLIATQGNEAIALIITLLKERAVKQQSGFQINSRRISKALGEHFDLDYGGVWRLAAFVMDALVARGILQPFNTTEKRVVFRVDASLVRNPLPEIRAAGSEGSHTPLGFRARA